MTDRTKSFLANNNLRDAEDIDALIELASLMRELIDEKMYTDIRDMLNYTVSNNYYEAFSWCMGILQEELEKEMCGLSDFDCMIGRRIPDYDEFIKRLQINLKEFENGVETVYDKNGEVESFFNVLVYRTVYKYIYLVSSENFDTNDNDYVQYRMLFSRKEKWKG